MRLWDWAMLAYAAPGVQSQCLALQDQCGQSVCLLLWAAWADESGCGPSPDCIDAAAAMARSWEDEVIAPLRRARRGLALAPGLEAAERSALKAKAHGVELAAEQTLLQALEVLTPPQRGPRGDSAAAMAAASAAWGLAAPFSALQALSDAFPSA
jgi:uncharacterized protein (TIGR02444 family)